MNTDALVLQLGSPVAIQLATVGAGLKPESVRGFGIDFDRASQLLSVVVFDAQSTAFQQALAVSTRLAVNLTNPVNLRGVQVKGPLAGIEQPSTKTAAVAVRYFEVFCAALTGVGFEPEQLRGFFHRGPARWIRLRPELIFNQTPGPGAGNAL